MLNFVIGFSVGLGLGVTLTAVFAALRRKESTDQRDQLQQHMREAFQSLAAEALDANSRRLSESAGSQLDGKKALIDQAVQTMNERLNKLQSYLTTIEKERKEEIGRLSGSVTDLSRTAGQLHQVLASSKRRGAWGERMADDILRLAGLCEGVNYTKQSTEAAEAGRPDFTFYLPNDLKLNMDVKFPLENYRAFLDAEDADRRNDRLAQLVRDVKNHVKAIASRGYIDTRSGTVPYVLVFLPSEQIFSLVLETQPDLIDEALRMNVVLASPMTLYAMVAVIRQAAENINVMKTADEVLDILAEFHKQWTNYNIELDKLGQRIEQTASQYQTVSTTRTNVLQRQIDRVDDLRTQRGLGDGES